MRGTWLHRKLGDRLFAREMWQPERGRFAVGCVIGVFFAMMPVPVQMLAAALLAFLVRVEHSCGGCLHLGEQSADHAVNSIESVLSRFVFPRAGRRPIHPKEDMLALLAQAPWPLLVGALISGTVLSIGAYPLALAAWDWLSARVLQSRKEKS